IVHSHCNPSLSQPRTSQRRPEESLRGLSPECAVVSPVSFRAEWRLPVVWLEREKLECSVRQMLSSHCWPKHSKNLPAPKESDCLPSKIFRPQAVWRFPASKGSVMSDSPDFPRSRSISTSPRLKNT